jgi:hypothetical protein
VDRSNGLVQRAVFFRCIAIFTYQISVLPHRADTARLGFDVGQSLN